MPARRLLLPLLLLSMSLQAADWQYLTVPGDTLIGIGRQYLRNPGDWPRVQAENRVDIPEHLPVNTHLRIPVALLKVTPAPATVTAVQGNVRVRTGSGDLRPLRTGDQLQGGESVLTGPRSSAHYRFADGTSLTQQASSKLAFGRLAAYGKTGMVATEVSLDSGRLEASAARQLAPAGGFRVRTPVAVAGLRGTDFRINVAEDGKRMSSEVTTGEVAVTAQGKTVRVAAGEGSFTEAGKPPSPARALLPAPDLSGMPTRVTRLPLGLAWPTQPDAAAWRVRLARDTAFTAVLLDDVVTRPAVDWGETLADGVYTLRVRAIDETGMEGLDAEHSLTLDAHPLPPLALAPVLGEHLDGSRVRFRWSTAAGARGYVLQIAPTPEFTHGLIERRLGPVVEHEEDLGEGEWHWRLASLDETGQAHAFSAHRAFVVIPRASAPAAPTDLKMDMRVHPIAVSWQGQAPRYRVVVAPAGDFFRPMLVQESDGPRTFLPGLPPGQYQLRVIALGPDGAASPPSAGLAFQVIPVLPFWPAFILVPAL
ncbi:MAG TPA: FecR domain-containing protein [Thiobacillaceae bacterium]|nr:FecR domain-containing protein [Thiobacillaceae bacterium]HNU63305.1 FecR domain-containing protein [Thiobacillaceae bacterium]